MLAASFVGLLREVLCVWMIDLLLLLLFDWLLCCGC